jgi:hypothetical protein
MVRPERLISSMGGCERLPLAMSSVAGLVKINKLWYIVSVLNKFHKTCTTRKVVHQNNKYGEDR